MSPFQGSGAGQAIEDAYLLATLLGQSETTLESAAFALRVYDNVRRPFASKVAEESRLCGQHYTLKFGDVDFDKLEGDSLTQKLLDLGETVSKRWQWSWTTTLDSDVQTAISMLRSPGP
jgi:salicylate hydroxylase